MGFWGGGLMDLRMDGLDVSGKQRKKVEGCVGSSS